MSTNMLLLLLAIATLVFVYRPDLLESLKPPSAAAPVRPRPMAASPTAAPGGAPRVITQPRTAAGGLQPPQAPPRLKGQPTGVQQQQQPGGAQLPPPTAAFAPSQSGSMLFEALGTPL